MRKYLIMATMMLHASLAVGAELTLFDISLRTASRDEVRKAITKAGGKLKTSSRDVDKYDASAIGLPEAEELEVIYLENKLVIAQYSLSRHGGQDERVRKMLTAKYGQPRDGREFDSEYVGDGKYHWRFDNGMELVYTKEFFGDRYISYVNTVQQARLAQIVKDADRRSAEKEAAAKKNVF